MIGLHLARSLRCADHCGYQEQMALERGDDMPDKPDALWPFAEFWRGKLQKMPVEVKPDSRKGYVDISRVICTSGSSTSAPHCLMHTRACGNPQQLIHVQCGSVKAHIGRRQQTYLCPGPG